MHNDNRTDRILIAVALIIFLMAGGAFYFDGWMWGNRRGRGDQIGLVSNKTGDVRVKFDGDLKWQTATRGQDLVYNDSIYAGPGAKASLALGSSEMTVSENTLVVLRRQEDANFLNLSYGSMFGQVGKSDRLVIDTGDGKPIELTSKNNAKIELKKVGGKTELRVISGTAEMISNGKKETIDQASKVVVEKEAPKVERLVLESLTPRRDHFEYSETPMRIAFAWKWNRERKPAASETYELEFSSTPGFEKILTRKTVTGQLSTSFLVNKTLSLFYRVRAPGGELSQVEKVNFVRMQKPVIVMPVMQAKIGSVTGVNAPVEIEFRRPTGATVHYQISNESEYSDIYVEDNTPEYRAVHELPIGQYFMRARSDLGNGRFTGWTETVPFSVDPLLREMKLSSVSDRRTFVIPNKEYPSFLYNAPPGTVRAHLAKQGVLNDFFPFEKEDFDEIKMRFDAGQGSTQEMSQQDKAWPAKKLSPDRYQYQYQVTKSGMKSTPWSKASSLEITMEPPRPAGETVYGVVKKNGEVDAQWSFTPLLFARSYDVEISHDPSFNSARELHLKSPSVKTSLPSGETYWRARARDEKGRIISAYSSGYMLPPVPAPVPTYLAKNEEREPAAVEESITKAERDVEEYTKNGWWIWGGVGYSFTDYRQSIPTVGTVSDRRTKGPGQYLEAGFIGGKGWGGIFSTKYTPGDIGITEGANFNQSYVWSTMSIEGTLRKTSKFSLYESPIVYGMRVGVQQHRTPFLFLTRTPTNPIELKTNEMTTASAGLLAEWSRRRWTHYWLMRYQFPFSSKAQGGDTFTVSPVFAFDGSIGSSYNLTRQMKIGAFWYGQWHQYSFVYTGNGQTNPGFQSLFFSNVDLRVGYDF